MRKSKLLTAIIFIALVFSSLIVLKVLNPALAEDTIVDSVYDTVCNAVYDATGIAIGPVTETSEDKTQPTEEPAVQPEQVNKDVDLTVEEEADLPLFLEEGTLPEDAPIASVEVISISGPDGQEVELMNNDLTIEEKTALLKQGFTVDEIYGASEKAYLYGMDTKTMLNKVKQMKAEEVASGKIDKEKAGIVKVNWAAVDQKIRKEQTTKIINQLKDKYPDEIAEMTTEGIPADVQMKILVIQGEDESIKVKDLIKEYKENGKAGIKNKQDELMKKQSNQSVVVEKKEME